MNTQSEKAPSCAAQRRRSLIVLLVLVAITLGYLALDRLAEPFTRAAQLKITRLA